MCPSAMFLECCCDSFTYGPVSVFWQDRLALCHISPPSILSFLPQPLTLSAFLNARKAMRAVCTWACLGFFTHHTINKDTT